MKFLRLKRLCIIAHHNESDNQCYKSSLRRNPPHRVVEIDTFVKNKLLLYRSQHGIRLMVDSIKNSQRCDNVGFHILRFHAVTLPLPPYYHLWITPGSSIPPIQTTVPMKTTTPHDLIFPILLDPPSWTFQKPLLGSRCTLWQANLINIPASTCCSNFHDLQAVLPEGMHPLNRQIVSIPIIDSGSADDDLYYYNNNNTKFEGMDPPYHQSKLRYQ